MLQTQRSAFNFKLPRVVFLGSRSEVINAIAEWCDRIDVATLDSFSNVNDGASDPAAIPQYDVVLIAENNVRAARGACEVAKRRCPESVVIAVCPWLDSLEEVSDRVAIIGEAADGILDFEANATRSFVSGFFSIIEGKRKFDERLKQPHLSAMVHSRLVSDAGVIHDIKNLVGIAAGYIDCLPDGREQLGPSDMRVDNAVVRNRVQMIMDYCGGLINLLATQQADLSNEHRELEIEAELKKVTDLLSVVANIKGVKLSLEMTHLSQYRLPIDPLIFSRIIFNVVQNAVKHSDRGTIRVVVSECRALDGNQLIQIDVVDEGRGIEGTRFETVFAPFHSVESFSSGLGKEGYGLGLATSRALARAVGGDVTIETSAPGVGTAIRIRLPMSSLEMQREGLRSKESGLFSLSSTDEMIENRDSIGVKSHYSQPNSEFKTEL